MKTVEDNISECLFEDKQLLISRFLGVRRIRGSGTESSSSTSRKVEVDNSEQLRQLQLSGQQMINQYADSMAATPGAVNNSSDPKCSAMQLLQTNHTDKCRWTQSLQPSLARRACFCFQMKGLFFGPFTVVHGRSRSVHGPFTVGRVGVRRFGTETRSYVVVHALPSDRRRMIYLVQALCPTCRQTWAQSCVCMVLRHHRKHWVEIFHPVCSRVAAEKTGAQP